MRAMKAIIDLAPGADASALAAQLVRRIRKNLDDPKRLRVFNALRATIFVVDFDSGDCISLRFDHGRLTVHEGPIGVPTVTFGGPHAAVTSLDQIHWRNLRRAVLPGEPDKVTLVEDTGGRSSILPPQNATPRASTAAMGLRDLAKLFVLGDLKIYGMIQHPRTVSRFLRLIR